MKSTKLKIIIASDHGGFKLKKKIITFLEEKSKKEKYSIEDLGPYSLNQIDDYPDYVIPLGEKVVKTKRSLGIVICRNGQGVCIAANKVKGVRAVTGFSVREAKTTKLDDNANVLSIPADYLSEALAKKIVLSWLKTSFSGKPRHKRRLAKVKKYEK